MTKRETHEETTDAWADRCPRTWLDEEIADGQLPDKHLDKRLRQIFEQMGGAMGQTIPRACQDWANTKAAYFAQSLTSKQITATQQLCVDKSDGTPVCVTGDQLAGVLSGTPAVQPSGPTSPAAPDTEAPIITTRGNNPARVNVGITDNDLGATVTDNVDTNVGIHTFVGDTPIDQAVIDTSSPATYHVNYVATDAAGNTATSTRTVIVQAATSSPSGQ